VEVVLADDGVGSAVAPTDRSGAGLGLKIIAASVAQLGGEFDRDATDRGNG
jgi:two-component sensor histidine kinase